MSIKKNNTYFKENDGKVYYFDENGIKKEVPSTAFGNLQDQIDNLGSPLTYSGAKSVDELNELEEIKQGTVYTVTGTSGTLTAGNVEVKQGDEVAFATPNWAEIGKDIDNSWKQWSEDNGSFGNEHSIYIGKNNNVSSNQYNNSVAIGDSNTSYNGSIVIGKSCSATEGAISIGGYGNSAYNGAVSIGQNNLATLGSLTIGQFNKVIAGGGAIGYSSCGGKGGYVIGDNNYSRKYEIINPTDASTSSIEYEDVPLNNLWAQWVFGLNNFTQFKKNDGSNYHGMPFQIGSDNIVQDEITWNGLGDYVERTYHNGAGFVGTFNIGTNNSAFDEGINIGYKNTILIGDASGASINIGKNNINRMGIIIGHGNVTYDTMTGISSTTNKSNAYSWILGFNNSANGASVAIGCGTKAESNSYTFGGGEYNQLMVQCL